MRISADSRWIVVALVAGLLVGGGLRWGLAEVRTTPPTTPAAATRADGALPGDVTSPIAGVLPGRPVSLATRRGRRVEFDLTMSAEPTLSHDGRDDVRDSAWAAEMEEAIGAYAQGNLRDLFPGSEWYGSECYSTSCDVSFAIPVADAAVASDFPFLFSGVGVSRQREPERVAEGLVHYQFRVWVADRGSQARLTAAEFTAMQHDFALNHPERYESVKAALSESRSR